MYNATKVTGNMAVLAVFYFFLGLYVPGKLHQPPTINPVIGGEKESNRRTKGSVMMYKYMLRQRRKTLA